MSLTAFKYQTNSIQHVLICHFEVCINLHLRKILTRIDITRHFSSRVIVLLTAIVHDCTVYS